MSPKPLKPKPCAHRQLPLSIATAQTAYPSRFISAYRVVLVKDQHLPFANERLANSQQAQPIIKKLIQAAAILGITVHEHIIVSMFDDRYYSMADNGLIKSMHDHLS